MLIFSTFIQPIWPSHQLVSYYIFHYNPVGNDVSLYLKRAKKRGKFEVTPVPPFQVITLETMQGSVNA